MDYILFALPLCVLAGFILGKLDNIRFIRTYIIPAMKSHVEQAYKAGAEYGHAETVKIMREQIQEKSTDVGFQMKATSILGDKT